MAVDAQALWAKLKTDSAGLVTAVVQHHRSGAVLMVGHMNAEALARTLERGRVTFWSRSRDQLWEKGESSGHTLALRGTLSGEHGIGIAKQKYMPWEQAPELIEVQKKLKLTLDPHNLLNPGKIFPI